MMIVESSLPQEESDKQENRNNEREKYTDSPPTGDRGLRKRKYEKNQGCWNTQFCQLLLLCAIHD